MEALQVPFLVYLYIYSHLYLSTMLVHVMGLWVAMPPESNRT